MDTPSEETLEDSGNQRRKSIGSGGSGSSLAGSKAKRYSIGITPSQKNIGEKGNIVPNYLRASTGSCHDLCKFGKHHEHSKSAIPIKFKSLTVINKEKVTKTVVPLERKKTTPVKKLEPLAYPKIRTTAELVEVTKRVVSLPSKEAQISKPILSINGKGTGNEIKIPKQSTSCVQPSVVTVNRGSSEGSNVVIKKKDIKSVKKKEMTPKTDPVKKVLTESHSPKASFRKATSLKAIKYRVVKQVTPLKDQNRLQKTEPKKSSSDKVRTKTLHGVEASELKPETIEFDFTRPSMELVNTPICSSSESFSGGNIAEEESTVIHPVFESAELFMDKELLEESLVVESSELLEDPLMELVNDPVCNSSESFLGGKEKSTIVSPVNESSELFLDKELLEESLVVESSELLEDPLMELVNDLVCNSSESFLGEKEKSTIVSPVYESSELFSDNHLLEEALIVESSELLKEVIAPIVVESSQSNSEKEFVQEESLITPPLYESSESIYDDEEVVLEDESEDTDDDEEQEESESTYNENVFATTNNDEMETSVGNQKKIPRKGRRVNSEDKDDEDVKLRFRRGKILDLQSENNSPRRLKFRRGKVVEGKEGKQHIARRSFEKKYVEEVNDSKTGLESVVLKHQGEQEKKDAQGLFNNVIEETASKLVETRKSKVKALVGAFETVISLQDGNP